MKCQNITWNQWNNRSIVWLTQLVEKDAAEKAEAAAEELGDDVILQQIDAEEAAEIEVRILKLKMLREMCLLIYY